MSTPIAINGFGRIGRAFVRSVLKNDTGFDVVAVNDLADAPTMAHLLQYDSVYGPLEDEVVARDGEIAVGDRAFRYPERAGSRSAPLARAGRGARAGVDRATTASASSCELHLEAGAERVLVSAPAKGPDVTLVLGVNDGEYDPAEHRIVSNASCTTNCVAPVAKVLNDAFGIERGFMTTIHAYTNDQRTLDFPHKDLRRARAAAVNLIPTSTGAAKAVGLVLPELDGKLDGIAVRAPVPDGSLVDLTARLARPADVDEVNAAFAEAAAGPLDGILRYSEAPLVSTDVIGSSYSAVFDSLLTMASGDEAKVFAWYDNEWGYTCRLVDVARLMTGALARVPA